MCECKARPFFESLGTMVWQKTRKVKMISSRQSVWADLVTVVKHTVDKHWNEIETYKKIKDTNSNL